MAQATSTRRHLRTGASSLRVWRFFLTINIQDADGNTLKLLGFDPIALTCAVGDSRILSRRKPSQHPVCWRYFPCDTTIGGVAGTAQCLRPARRPGLRDQAFR